MHLSILEYSRQLCRCGLYEAFTKDVVKPETPSGNEMVGPMQRTGWSYAELKECLPRVDRAEPLPRCAVPIDNCCLSILISMAKMNAIWHLLKKSQQLSTYLDQSNLV